MATSLPTPNILRNRPVVPIPPKPNKRGTFPGNPIALTRVISLLRELRERKTFLHGPGLSVYIRATHDDKLRHASVAWLAQRPFGIVVTWAIEGRIYECLHVEGAVCRCRECDWNRAKNHLKGRRRTVKWLQNEHKDDYDAGYGDEANELSTRTCILKGCKRLRPANVPNRVNHFPLYCWQHGGGIL